MNLQVRDGKFDVVAVAGPRVPVWPSAGVRALTRICADMGLSVGSFGGEALWVRGVLPLPGTGGLVLVQDVQGRVHRIQARAVVKVFAAPEMPDPFPGWRTQGLLPLSTAVRLRRESQVSWDPVTVVLGSGNRALRFASELLEGGAAEVYCVEGFARWDAKRFAGWEVERRRFEALGGRLLEARPISLARKAALLWELRLQDAQGVRVLETARVVSAGPFRDVPGVREYPAGSFLFELVQTAPALREDDVEGWVLEEERGRYLAAKIARALIPELGERRESLDAVYRRARSRLKRNPRHRNEPFMPSYQGKWLSGGDSARIRAFSGVPRTEQRVRKLASIECFEEIPCDVCKLACPESAIAIGKIPRPAGTPILDESRCTGCGICVGACPSAAIPLIHEREERSVSSLTLPWRGARAWKAGEFATLVNRRGESLGSARVVAVVEAVKLPEGKLQLVELEVPTHLIWDARGLRRLRAPAAEDEAYLEAVSRSASAENRVEIQLNGEKRLVRDQVPVTVALFEAAENRADDALFCKDGSCGLCHVLVDGVKKLACQTEVRRGMSVELRAHSAAVREASDPSLLCPCQGISPGQVLERLSQGKLRSPEAVLSVTPVGEGRCHGQLCLEPFRRVLLDQGLDASHWSDWRFPWSDWVLS
ncbi:MAG: 4Fe-4S binding protein [Oligoflexia bacterium]|nr:4Fe-4S binding protein [Oligoflexia bacterium]